MLFLDTFFRNLSFAEVNSKKISKFITNSQLLLVYKEIKKIGSFISRIIIKNFKIVKKENLIKAVQNLAKGYKTFN